VILRLVFGALLAASAVPAAAITLTFDQLAHDTPDRLYGPSTGAIDTRFDFVEQGFAIGVSPAPVIVWGRNDVRNAGQGGATLTNLDGRARFGVLRVGGGSFTLNSIAVASFYNGSQSETGFGNSFTVRFNSDLTTDQVFTIDALPGFQTFTFNRTGVSTFQIFNTYAQLDNFVIDQAPAVGGIPEPAIWALLIAGFGLTGASMRRRRTIPEVLA
jgi:hypothetical protein